MDKFYCVFWLLCCLSLTTAQKITHFQVPDVVNIRTQDSAILDCDYELSSKISIKNTEGLVIKWFFENGTKPVYQWIPGMQPQSLGILKNKLDLNYKASNEPLLMHRALRINQLSFDLSGEYLCVVSTFLNEDSMRKKMIVLEPPKAVTIYQVKENDDTVTVICSAQESYPEPMLNITYGGSPVLRDTQTDTSKSENGLYNVTTIVVLEDESLDEPTEFFCNLHIPDTEYREEVQLKYFPDSAGSTVSPSTWVFLTTVTLVAVYFS